MELYQLRTFVAVASEKSITRAAKRLFTTPPAVSAHIKALEEELHVVLFTRTSKGMEITDKGTLLLRKAEQTLFSAQDLVNHATELQSHLLGRISIGLNALPAFLRVPQLVKRLQENCPGIELDLIASASGRIIENLNDKSLDSGYIFGPVNHEIINAQPLCQSELVIAAPKQWQQQLEQAGWHDVARLPWIHSPEYCPFEDLTDTLFRRQGLQYQLANTPKTGDDATKVELISAGIGLALLEKHEAQQAAAQERLIIWPTDSICCELSFACLRQREQEPLLKAIIGTVSQIWQN